ncbi:MAG TPA: hypothetical protein VMV72_09410 [Verrucomicrobiae bacterium]|nr:hypothetical protein [Verrucomicrobiae bacterium]
MSVPILIITAGDWRFATLLEHSISAARKFGYDVQAYDLGNLGFGVPFTVDDEHFRKHGYYGNALPGEDLNNPNRWRTRARFKPAVVRHALLTNPGRLIVWLDGDALLHAPIDEIATDDYDVGIPVRKITETWRYPNTANHAFQNATKFKVGEINAGVLFFWSTAPTAAFVERWSAMTDQIGNDQFALNKLVNPNDDRLTGPASKRFVPFTPKLLKVAGARVKTFPYEYNWRRWPRQPREGEAKVLHFCGRWGKEEAQRRGLATPSTSERGPTEAGSDGAKEAPRLLVRGNP